MDIVSGNSLHEPSDQGKEPTAEPDQRESVNILILKIRLEPREFK